jgi:hypothetical protein
VLGSRSGHALTTGRPSFASCQEPRPEEKRAIKLFLEVKRMKGAILAVATLSAVWHFVYLAPDIRRYMRIRAM